MVDKFYPKVEIYAFKSYIKGYLCKIGVPRRDGS